MSNSQQTKLHDYNSEKSNRSPYVFIKLEPAKITHVYREYWRLAAKRQDIFFNKMNKKYPPWTDDHILKQYKFTNAYRASDRVSQYLIKNIIYSGPASIKDVFFRILIFKIFNKIETWEALEKHVGEISYSNFNFEDYDAILQSIIKNKKPIYSAAYIMASGKSVFGFNRKHQNHLKMVESMMINDLPNKILDSKSMQEAFSLIKSYPSLGDFLAYQYVTDINYSEITDFSELEFVVAGPGAKSGIYKCFSDLGGLNETEIIKLMVDRQEQEFERLGIEFKDLWGRKLQLIDCQNLFCEIDKYSRVAYPEVKGLSDRKRIKQKYNPQKGQIDYWFPPKWGINEAIKA
ncbi:MAG: nucleotide kinase domain-containing protein [Balneolales bacterium]